TIKIPQASLFNGLDDYNKGYAVQVHEIRKGVNYAIKRDYQKEFKNPRVQDLVAVVIIKTNEGTIGCADVILICPNSISTHVSTTATPPFPYIHACTRIKDNYKGVKNEKSNSSRRFNFLPDGLKVHWSSASFTDIIFDMACDIKCEILSWGKQKKISCSHGSLTALTVLPLLFNMAERQQLPLQVIGLIRAGHSASSAARTIGVPLATAKRWAKLFHENNEVSNRAIPGRPRISTREEDANLVTEAENHHFRSAFELKMASNFSGSPLTARRRLRERGIRSRRTATKEHLKIEHIVDRLAYATIRQNFDWRNVIFSDEVVVSSSNYGPPRVYRIDGHRYDERFVARLYKSGRGSYAILYDNMKTYSGKHDEFNIMIVNPEKI
ncbi:hypothetical protein C0J52_27174, partial [Blattella germanica]